MTWVKICGITNLEDALQSVEAGADALGFVFYAKSPRKAGVETTREIIRELPGDIEKVGVFVDHEPEQVREIVLQTGLTTVQLHGKQLLDRVWSEKLSVEQSLGVRKMIPVIPGDSLKDRGVLISEGAHDKVFALLFDSQSNGNMWRDIAITNKKNIGDALHKLEQRLAHIRENLDSRELAAEFERAHQLRKEKTPKPIAPRRIEKGRT